MTWSWFWFWQPPCVLRTVIANLKDDPTTAIRGVLWSARGGWFVLRDGYALKAGNDPAKIDGDVVLHRSNVSFFQVLP